MEQLEQFIDSREVAEMVGKEHSKLLRDIRNYVEQLGQANFGQSDFFTESTYVNTQNKKMPCYQATKKGCEFIAHKLTGVKGTEFTAKYINRFHEMEDAIKSKVPSGAELIALAVVERGYRIYIPKCVKTECVDGERIKEDTFYKLVDGEFVEVCK